MPNSLGLYIEKNLIKYAKVSKEHEKIKIEAFGVKFYDNLNGAIDQIISETNSSRVPISINLSEEMYNYFELFSMMKADDLKQAIETEFDLLCEERGFNKKTIESRYILSKDITNSEKIRAIHISTNKAELTKSSKLLNGYKLTCITALPMVLQNLIKMDNNKNVAIIDMEGETTLTTIVKGEINSVDVISYGSEQILDVIADKENSYAKAYEICKNTTIYTVESSHGTTNEYIEEIMPTLYNIANNAKQIIDENKIHIDKIYLTGTLSVINNLDLYFQEYFTSSTCEVLRPYFLSRSLSNTHTQEYMEVSSAISLALQGIDGDKKLNFKINLENARKGAKKINYSEGKFDGIERWLLRTCMTFGLFIILYSFASITVFNSIKAKYDEAEERRLDVQKEIDNVENDIERINKLTQNYSKLKQNLLDSNQKETERYKNKNAIPSLLNKIMTAIPSKVQITQIENTIDRHVVIKAQSEEYENLGLFIGVLKQSGILNNVKSDSGIKQDSLAKVTIEGELP